MACAVDGDRQSARRLHVGDLHTLEASAAGQVAQRTLAPPSGYRLLHVEGAVRTGGTALKCTQQIVAPARPQSAGRRPRATGLRHTCGDVDHRYVSRRFVLAQNPNAHLPTGGVCQTAAIMSIR